MDFPLFFFLASLIVEGHDESSQPKLETEMESLLAEQKTKIHEVRYFFFSFPSCDVVVLPSLTSLRFILLHFISLTRSSCCLQALSTYHVGSAERTELLRFLAANLHPEEVEYLQLLTTSSRPPLHQQDHYFGDVSSQMISSPAVTSPLDPSFGVSDTRPSSNPGSQTSSPPLVMDHLLQDAPVPATNSSTSTSSLTQQGQNLTLTPAHKAPSGVLPSFTQLFSAVQPQRSFSLFSPSPGSFRLTNSFLSSSFLEPFDAEGTVNPAQELLLSGQPDILPRTPSAPTVTIPFTTAPPAESSSTMTSPTTAPRRVQIHRGQLQVTRGLERAHSGTDTEEIVSDEELSGWVPVQKKQRTE